MIQTSGVDHVVLHVNDVQRAKKFYTDVLGMTVYREDDRQVFLCTPGSKEWRCSSRKAERR